MNVSYPCDREGCPNDGTRRHGSGLDGFWLCPPHDREHRTGTPAPPVPAPPAPPVIPTPPPPVVPALSPLRRRELLVTLVGSQPGISVAEAAEVLDCSPKTIGNIARDLHAKGLLDPPVRHPNRYNRLYLHGATPAHITSKE